MRPMPSGVLRTLLHRLLGAADEDALGDLEEEFARRRSRGRGAAELWYAREAWSLGLAVIVRRVGHQGTHGQGGMMSGLGRDLRQALRSVAREPGVTLVVAVTLAVAVGATTAIFAVADAAFLRPLPYPQADRLVSVYSGSREDPDAAYGLSPLDVRDIETFEAVVEDVGVWSVAETVHLTGTDEPRRLEAPRASASLFRILGTSPELGRFFTPEEEAPGGDDAVVLSHGLWTSAFGGDPSAVGRSVELDGRSYRIVGVAPPTGVLPREADLWRALALGPEWYDPGRWGWQFLRSVVRLRPGTGLGGVDRAFTDRLAESVPQRVERGQTRVVRSLYEERVGAGGPAILLLLVAVALVLAMACANVMNVLLARSERRSREYGLRRALGSGAGPLGRMVLVETGALALLGTLGGLLVAYAGLAALSGADLEAIAALGVVRLDPRVIGFALFVTVATVAVFGAAPMLRALRADPQTILRESGTRAGGSRAAKRLRDGLVVVQVAAACTLLAAVGLSTSAFLRLVDRDPGFRAEGVLAATIELPAGAYPVQEGVALYRGLVERLEALPGVTSAGGVQFLPLTGTNWSASIDLVNADPSVTDPDPGGNMRPTAPGYFRTMGIQVLEGRTFTEADDVSAAPVVIVDETLARRYWPDGAVGRQVHVGALSQAEATIVGVVGAVPDESLARPGRGNVYFPILQRPMRRMVLVARTDGDAAALAPAVRAVVREMDPRIPIVDLAPLQATLEASVAGPRIALLLLVAFGVVAALLAAVGIYGVLAYAVARRTNEIGTRMALGAAPSIVLFSVVRDALRLWIGGALLGGLGVVGMAGLLTRLVDGVSVGDPLPYLVAFAGLGGVAVAAALLPAIRATSIDPTEALRAD